MICFLNVVTLIVSSNGTGDVLGTFEDTLLNVHGIDGMTNLKLFPIG
jgi:hypothetical protein